MRSALRTPLVPLALLVAPLAAAQTGHSTSTSSVIGAINSVNGGVITGFGSAADDLTSSVTASKSFTGVNRAGATQTMTYTGTCVNSAQYGVLRAYASGRLTNSYYNAGNAVYADGRGGVVNANGSPDNVCSLGFSTFDDTLQFGGALQSGYRARYLFHVDGTNSGYGSGADLAVDIAGHENDFFAFDPGAFSADWATDDVAINGQTPQKIHVQFSNQVVINAASLADGGTYDGLSDFSATLRLMAVVVVDANGNPVTGVTIKSDSGAVYPTPEPSGLAALGLGALALLRRRRRS